MWLLPVDNHGKSRAVGCRQQSIRVLRPFVVKAMGDELTNGQPAAGQHRKEQVAVPLPGPRAVRRRHAVLRKSMRPDDREASAVAQVMEVEGRCLPRTAQHEKTTVVAQDPDLARDELAVTGRLDDEVDALPSARFARGVQWPFKPFPQRMDLRSVRDLAAPQVRNLNSEYFGRSGDKGKPDA